jgi:hypothetical protein
MKKILSLLVLSLVLVSCSKKPEELLVGKWALSSEPDELYMEFYEDGSFQIFGSFPETGDWSILDGPRLKLARTDDNIDVYDDLQISENEMTALDKGNLEEFVRIN